jgi:hypothetical protein
MAHLHFLSAYPQIIQRIAIDKPKGWEWRFASELLKHLNNPEINRLNNLRSGLYYIPKPRIKSEDFMGWVVERTRIMSNLIRPLPLLFDRLVKSFGDHGEPGDIHKIHETCVLIRDALQQAVGHEENLLFSIIPDEGEEIKEIFIDIIGKNMEKIYELPEKLDELVSLIEKDHGGTKENPYIVNWKMKFELPDELNEKFSSALRRYEASLFN